MAGRGVGTAVEETAGDKRSMSNAAGLGGGTVIEGVYKIKRPNTYAGHVERVYQTT